MAHACMNHRIRQHCFSPVVTSREIRPPIYLSSQAALAQLLHAVLEKGKADRCTGAGVTPIQPVPRVVVAVVHSATILEEGEDYCANELRSFFFTLHNGSKSEVTTSYCRPSEGRIMRMGSMAARLLQSQSVVSSFYLYNWTLLGAVRKYGYMRCPRVAVWTSMICTVNST